MANYINPKFKEMAEDKAKEAVDTLHDKAQETAKSVKKSSEDWLGYVKEHPLQTIILGFACFGLGSLLNKLKSK